MMSGAWKQTAMPLFGLGGNGEVMVMEAWKHAF